MNDRASERVNRRLNRRLNRPHFKAFAILLIAFLAFGDTLILVGYFSNYELVDIRGRFTIGDGDGFFATWQYLHWLYGFLFAICLEGSATFTGNFLAKVTDRARLKKGELLYAWIGLFISIAGVAYIFFVLIRFRLFMVGGGVHLDYPAAGSFLAPFYDAPEDFFFTAIPIATSIIAILISWSAFKTDKDELLGLKVDVLEDKYLERRRVFSNERNKLKDAWASLWTNLTNHKTPPKLLSEYRNACIPRIRNKLIENCIISFRSEMNRYNWAVENELKLCVLKLMKHITLSDEEDGDEVLNLREILDDFNESRINHEGAWDSVESRKIIEVELCHLLDNAIKVAQQKTSFTYPLEGREKKRGAK